MDLRCPNRKHGVILRPSTDDGLVEIACPSRWCGKRVGVVVLHTFNTRTGELVNTRRYRQPEGGVHATRDNAPVRSA